MVVVEQADLASKLDHIEASLAAMRGELRTPTANTTADADSDLEALMILRHLLLSLELGLDMVNGVEASVVVLPVTTSRKSAASRQVGAVGTIASAMAAGDRCWLVPGAGCANGRGVGAI